MKMKREEIKRCIFVISSVLFGVMILYFALHPKALQDLKSLLVSLAASVGVFAKEYLGDILGDLLNLDKQKEIDDLKKVDEEIIERLDESSISVEKVEKALEDTQDIADQILDKLNDLEDKLEKKGKEHDRDIE